MQRESSLRKVLHLWLATAAALLCMCSAAVSQQKVEEGETLHVYTNLLQIPVLILSQKHQPLPPIEPDKFLLHLGSNPPFRPRVRLEGEDPITLAVLIDGALDGPRLPQMSEGLAAMARDQLHPQDRIALYGLDGCKLRRTSALKQADANTVRAAVKTLEDFRPYQQHWHGEKCASPTPLWDALAWVAQSLNGEPGRRVVLVITNGEDGGSKLGPDAARLAATRNGVAVFSLAERFKVRQGNVFSPGVIIASSTLSALAYVTEGSGGMVMETTRNNVAGTLASFPRMLRGRYIVEFSRPAGMTAGSHFLVVTAGQPKDFIRPAGTSMPVADPVAPDPTVQHGPPEPAQTVETSEPEPLQSKPEPVMQASPLPPAPAPSAARTTPVAHPTQVQTTVALRKPSVDPADVTGEVQPAGTNPGRR